MPYSPRYLAMTKLCDELAELYSHISAATAHWLALLGRLDEDGYLEEGYKTLAHWLAWRCGMSITTARDHIRTAQRLRQRPLIAAAMERGELSYSKVRALMRLEDDCDEQLMLTYARCASASQLETIVRGCRRSAAVEHGQERQFAERSFSWHRDEGGGVVFNGRLPAEQGALVVKALEAALDELGPPPPEIGEDGDWSVCELTTSPPARRADAFLAVATSALAERTSSSDVHQLVVHVDLEALRSDLPGAGDCRLDDGTPLPSALARKLACDASIVRIVERDGAPLSVGRRTRTIPSALKRTLHIRDNGCRFPGCTQRHHTDAHHIEHWADGGETSARNLVTLCRFHHTLIHKGLFTVRREPAGTFTFLRANGTVVAQAPRPPRGDCGRLRSTNTKHAVAAAPWVLYPRDANPTAHLGWAAEAILDSRPMRE